MNTHDLNGAAINETFVDSSVRSFTSVVAYALIAASPRALRRATPNIAARGDVGVRGRLVAHAQTAVTVAAALTLRVRAAVGVPSSVVGVAAVTLLRPAVRVLLAATAAAQVSLVARRLAATPVGAQPRADVAGHGAVLRGATVDAPATALVATKPRVAVRDLTVAVGSVTIDTRADVVKRVQFDEYAVEAQTYVVRFEDNIFYVR